MMISNIQGLRVTSFETRKGLEIEKLINSHGAVPTITPIIKEVQLPHLNHITNFGKKLLKNEYDIVFFLTGIGTKLLLEILETKFNKKELCAALKKATIISRGPKTTKSLMDAGLTPDFIVPEPGTWKDIVKLIDDNIQIKNKNVAIQEYSYTNRYLIKALRTRGCKLSLIKVYQIKLPNDLKPIISSIDSISLLKTDISIFTNSHQINNLIKIARKEGKEKELKNGLKNTLIASIGPRTSETLNSLDLRPDYETDKPTMSNLVNEIARVGRSLLNKKRIALKSGVNTNNWNRIDMNWGTKTVSARKKITYNSVFLKTCRMEPTQFTPVWIMRQAGRYLREYREIRSKVPFIELCKRSELAAEVTLMAVERLQVDAAIIFSDILLILESLGIGLEYTRGDGPRIKKPIRSAKALKNLEKFDPNSLSFVYDAIKITRRALDPEKALIGFAGGPFTIASYAIEGGGSRNYINTKSFMYRDPEGWNKLMELLASSTASYINKQISAGADVIQIFDSWIGCLSPDDYSDYVYPHMRKLISKINKDTPIIYFGTNTSSLLSLMKDTGCDILGLDWRVNLGKVWKDFGYSIAVQGNLDPVVLLGPFEKIKKDTDKILKQARNHHGHIFNLGHGVLPNTPVDNVLRLIDYVHERSSK